MGSFVAIWLTWIFFLSVIELYYWEIFLVCKENLSLWYHDLSPSVLHKCCWENISEYVLYIYLKQLVFS